MGTLKERLAKAMAGPPKVSQVALARACKIKPPSVNNWLSGKTQTIEGANLLAASKFLGVNAEWLATGRGPMRLNESELTTKNNSHPPLEPPSQPAIFDPDTVHEALVLLNHDESHSGAYIGRSRSLRLTELLNRVAADGGKRLSTKHNAEFEAEVRARTKGAIGGNDLAKRRAAKRKR